MDGCDSTQLGWVGMGRSVYVHSNRRGTWQRGGRAGADWPWLVGKSASPVRWDSVGWVQTQYAQSHAHNGDSASVPAPTVLARDWMHPPLCVNET
jgi:hypothetical protein